MLRGAQRILWAVGFAILGYAGMAYYNARLQQSRGNRELGHLLNNDYSNFQPRYGGLVGKVEIPRLHLSAVVFEGTDDPILAEGVGHLQGSALPGQKGNVVLAGHRDSFFRALRNIKDGDQIQVTTQYGTRAYKVSLTEIINPDQITVLEPTPTPTLTLVTCYPFHYVGHAPQRFIVRGVEADAGREAPKILMASSSVMHPDNSISGGMAQKKKAVSENSLPETASAGKPAGANIESTSREAAGRSDRERQEAAKKRLRGWDDFS